MGQVIARRLGKYKQAGHPNHISQEDYKELYKKSRRAIIDAERRVRPAGSERTNVAPFVLKYTQNLVITPLSVSRLTRAVQSLTVRSQNMVYGVIHLRVPGFDSLLCEAPLIHAAGL